MSPDHAGGRRRPTAGSYCEPDFLLGPAGCNPTSVHPREVALLTEVADSSLKMDTTTKAGLYARAGVCDYWVVNARSLTTRVYRGPSAKGPREKIHVHPSKVVTSLVIPSLTLRLADLAIADLAIADLAIADLAIE